jgi:hypothetical protein
VVPSSKALDNVRKWLRESGQKIVMSYALVRRPPLYREGSVISSCPSMDYKYMCDITIINDYLMAMYSWIN